MCSLSGVGGTGGRCLRQVFPASVRSIELFLLAGGGDYSPDDKIIVNCYSVIIQIICLFKIYSRCHNPFIFICHHSLNDSDGIFQQNRLQLEVQTRFCFIFFFFLTLMCVL